MDTKTVITSLVTGLIILIIKEVVDRLKGSTFNDMQRKYIDDRIVHKLNNYRMELDHDYDQRYTIKRQQRGD